MHYFPNLIGDVYRILVGHLPENLGHGPRSHIAPAGTTNAASDCLPLTSIPVTFLCFCKEGTKKIPPVPSLSSAGSCELHCKKRGGGERELHCKPVSLFSCEPKKKKKAVGLFSFDFHSAIF